MKTGKDSRRRARDVAHKEAVGTRLRVSREALEVTRRDWTERFGVSASMQSMWEGGANYPDIFFLIAVCEAYGLTLDWFLRGELAGVISSLSPILHKAYAEKSAASGAAGLPASGTENPFLI